MWLSVRPKLYLNAGDYVPMWVVFMWTTACYSQCGWAKFSVTDKTERHSVSYKAPLYLALLTTLTSFLATLSIIHLVSTLSTFPGNLSSSFPCRFSFSLEWSSPNLSSAGFYSSFRFQLTCHSSDGPFFTVQYNNENSHISNESAANTELSVNARHCAMHL